MNMKTKSKISDNKTGVIQMVCDICGKKGTRICRISETYGKGKDLMIIENIPMVSCSYCGESYFTADTLHEIERIKTAPQIPFCQTLYGSCKFCIMNILLM